MKYNSDVHQRRTIRLKDYDYSQSGSYFITICTHNRMLYFSQYPDLTLIVSHQWQEIPKRYEHVILDEFIIMPNHIHGIITVGAGLVPAPDITPTPAGLGIDARPCTDTKPGAGARPAPTVTVTVGEIVGTFKSLCIRDWLRYIEENGLDTVGKFWQRNYYERVIRNEDELNKVREYIRNNPLNWSLDRENPDRNENHRGEDAIPG